MASLPEKAEATKAAASDSEEVMESDQRPEAGITDWDIGKIEKASVMAGMIQQWLREDAELFNRRKEAAKETEDAKEAENEDDEEGVEEIERGDSIQSCEEDDNDDDFEDCDDGEDNILNFEGSADLNCLDDDEELLDEREFSPQDWMAFIQAMSDPKKAYPNGWKQMYDELKQCMQKTKKPFKAMALLT